MKKQIVKINGYYLARYKKWYHLRWRYIGQITTWTFLVNIKEFCLCNSEYEAEERFDKFFKRFEIIKKL